MKFNKYMFCLALIALFGFSMMHAAMVDPDIGNKKLDLDHYHDVGNIWLRVSNYGFFGSGSAAPYPSLEYPGGSGIDYLYQGALWFGAKKQRRDDLGRKLYWKTYPPRPNANQTVHENHPEYEPTMKPVIDTLVTIGFDGDRGLYEFLPAYNPLLVANSDVAHYYDVYNQFDQVLSASTRTQRRGVDDDGDGLIDEDGPGFTFPLRWRPGELPAQFESFAGKFIHEISPHDFHILSDPATLEIWYPLGFMDLSYNGLPAYNFAQPYDDDGDGRIDEDGSPVSEQDFIGYYYDYCPFGTSGDRDYGRDKGSNTHVPLNVRVRQMSYQWSYEYIKNLVYVEFNITNMNPLDELMDCAMGIYMDCDVGPQTWGSEKAADDKSGYVKGEGYEFAYTYDADGDGGLTTGMVGARVCTPDPEQLKFHCWYWKVGDGPDDFRPLAIQNDPTKTSNEKYWLLTGRNPKPDKISPLRREEDPNPHFEQASPNDTRFLFAFYGAQPGTEAYDDPEKRWNLKPNHTMKIVVAVFPGDNLEDLKGSARWAKEVYGQAQTLTTVVLPDTFPHYNPPEPPDIPGLFVDMQDNGNRLDLYWDNRSEFSYDIKAVSTAVIGWRNHATADTLPATLDSNSLYWTQQRMEDEGMPMEFRWSNDPDFEWNENSFVNPWTANRLRHDFQGYTVWGRSGSGSQEDWEMIKRWDKVDTDQDKLDYLVNSDIPWYFEDYGGYMGIDTGLPNPTKPFMHGAGADHLGAAGWMPFGNDIELNKAEYAKFYRFDDLYRLVAIDDEEFYGWPLFDPDKDWDEAQAEANLIESEFADLPLAEVQRMQARLFMHPLFRSVLNPEIYDEIVEKRLIPLQKFAFPINQVPTAEMKAKLRKELLARRFYKSSIMYPRKGVEYYVAVTAFDRGMPSKKLDSLESGRDASANMKVIFPGPLARNNMKDIMVVPNPYRGSSSFDGRIENDEKGDKSRRLWFINLPERCTISIYTLAGDLVQTLDHDGASPVDIVTISKAAKQGLTATGIHPWNLLTKNNQITAPGVYLFSVKNKADNQIKVGKFVIVK